MNYIKKLQAENEKLTSEKKEALEEVHELTNYLLSEKFKDDPTVQTRDVLYRIENLRMLLTD